MKQSTIFISILLHCLAGFTIGDVSTAKPEFIDVSLQPDEWEFRQKTVEFASDGDETFMRVLPGNHEVVSRNLKFSDGIIEFDLKLQDERVVAVFFRWQSRKTNERFYFRTNRSENPTAIDSIQYAPTVDGVNLWDMYFHYQSRANFVKEKWNRVKLVISGKQLRAYVNDMDTPALEVPCLEGDVSIGEFGFRGAATISNLRMAPNFTAGLDPNPGSDPTINDSRYIRSWQVSETISTPSGTDFKEGFIPADNTKWEPISAERRGLVNLTRRFGGAGGRRLVWLRTRFDSLSERTLNLRLGFSDEVWVMINKKPVYLDKNLYRTPMMKPPFGRCSIENASIEIPIQRGNNELLIGVAASFFGWGLVARLDDVEGLEFSQLGIPSSKKKQQLN